MMVHETLLSELQSGVNELSVNDTNPPTDWSALVAKAAEECSLEKISLTNIKLGGPAETALIKLLRDHSNTLRAVVLQDLHLSATTARIIADALPWTTLETLSLAKNGSLGPRGIKMWCEYMKKARALQELDCQACSMGHFGAQAVGQVLPPTLVSLNLSHNKLGADGIWKMANRLPKLTVLETLDLSHNQMGDDGCLELARNLSPSLRVLALAGNGMKETGMTELIRIFPQLLQLQVVDLSHNQLGNVSAKQLGSIMGKCQSLEVLDLSHNQIGDDGCVALVEGLLPPDDDDNESDDDNEESEEDYFDLDDEELEVQSGKSSLSINQPIDTIKHQESRLRELRLHHNVIRDEGAGAFVEYLDQTVALQTVTLQGNDISDARMRILDMLLKHRTILASPRKSFTTEASITPDTSEREEEGLPVETPRKEKAQDEGMVDISAIEQGRELLLSVASSDEGDAVPVLPMGYVTHITDKWSQVVCPHGAFGGLFRAIDQDIEQDSSLWLVRKLELSPAGKMEAIREAVLAELPQLLHPSIATLSATAVHHGAYAFLYDIPDASAVSLRKCLTDPEHRKALTWPTRLHVACCIASALDFLHQNTPGRKAALHGDLHPDSIYVTSDYEQVYVLDAGMSRLLATDRSRFAKGDVVYGTRAYRCPRYERGSTAYDYSCDIFALGIILSEIMTARLQRSKEKNSALACDVYYDCVLSGQPLRTDPLAGPVSKPLMQHLGKLALACLSPLPRQRPSSSTVAQILKELRQQESVGK